jgi:mitochondrial fission protein ELM1
MMAWSCKPEGVAQRMLPLQKSRVATCWVVVDEGAGFFAQAVGLAEAIGFKDAPVKRIGRLRWPFSWLPNRPAWASTKAFAESDTLEPPWPDLVISCGRTAAFAALAIRRESRGLTRLIHIQRPQTGAKFFDAIVAPEHDGLKGPNVLTSLGALHRVSQERLETSAKAIAPLVRHLPHPLIAVLIGGSNRYFDLGPVWARNFGRELGRLGRDGPIGLMVTTSRRTHDAASAALREELKDAPALIWSGEGQNPYYGFLGLADAIIVTCDSISMISEALATGKPVYLVKLPGKSRRFGTLFNKLVEEGYCRWFAGALELWPGRRLDEVRPIAAELMRRLHL